jgi:hypothetical protein
VRGVSSVPLARRCLPITRGGCPGWLGGPNVPLSNPSSLDCRVILRSVAEARESAEHGVREATYPLGAPLLIEDDHRRVDAQIAESIETIADSFEPDGPKPELDLPL